MAAHSTLGASSASRWFNCPGSVRMAKLAPPQPESPYAAEGTAAHELGELCLLGGHDADKFIGKSVYNHEVTAEMAEAVQVYLDEVRGAMLANPNAELAVEKRFKLDWIDKSMFGTNDACVITHFDTLYVFDYKHGQGVPVEIEGNRQLRYYALGAARDVDVTHIEMVIVQPRCPHKDGPVRRERITYEELIEWQDTELLPAVETALRDDAPLKAGDHCKWCPAKGQCPALRDLALAEAKVSFEDLSEEDTVTLPEPEILSDEEIAKILDSTKLLDDWLKAVHGVAEARLMGGTPIPGYKLVRGKANRKYKDEAEAAKAAEELFGRDKVYEKPKFRSIAQLEKALGKKAVQQFAAEHVYVPEGKIAVAPLSDKREEVSIQALASQSFTPLD